MLLKVHLVASPEKKVVAVQNLFSSPLRLLSRNIAYELVEGTVNPQAHAAMRNEGYWTKQDSSWSRVGGFLCFGVWNALQLSCDPIRLLHRKRLLDMLSFNTAVP